MVTLCLQNLYSLIQRNRESRGGGYIISLFRLILIAAKCLSSVLIKNKLHLETCLCESTDEISKENLHDFSGPHHVGIVRDQ